MAIFRRQIVCASGAARTKPGPDGIPRAKWLVAFWLPVPHGKQVPRDMRTRPSAVADAQPFELQALADGVLLEVTAAFVFPLDMPMSARREAVDKEWRAQLERRFGAAPEDLAPVGLTINPAALAS